MLSFFVIGIITTDAVHCKHSPLTLFLTGPLAVALLAEIPFLELKTKQGCQILSRQRGFHKKQATPKAVVVALPRY